MLFEPLLLWKFSSSNATSIRFATMAALSLLKALIPCAVLLCASGVDSAVRGSVRGTGTTYSRPGGYNTGIYYNQPATTVYRPVSYNPVVQPIQTVQTIQAIQPYTMTSAQCDNKWTTALLAEIMNYDNWKCSSRIMPDGSNVGCVITGPLTITTTISTYYVNSGCGWILPFFCDDTIRDLVTSMVGTQQAAAQPIPLGYTLIPGVGYYKMHTESLTWDQAKASCEAEGAHLATPSSANDYSSIYAYINSVMPTQAGVWVGFTDVASEGNYRSVTNQPVCMLGQLPFMAGQPDGGTLENCLGMGLQASSSLNDFQCSTPMPFICEQTLSTRLAVCRTVVNG